MPEPSPPEAPRETARCRGVKIVPAAALPADEYGTLVDPVALAFRVEDPAELKSVLKQATEYQGPTLVDIVCQPLHEARAPVSEWVA